jgi:hypothetical protein
MKAKLLLWLMALPWTARDRVTETVDERAERLGSIATAIVQASGGDRAKVAFLAVQAQAESDFDGSVQRCDCLKYQCDARRHRDGSVEFLAHGQWIGGNRHVERV